jgi:hypothetical protein
LGGGGGDEVASRGLPGMPGRPIESCTREGECAVSESPLFPESTDSFASFGFLEGSASGSRCENEVPETTKFGSNPGKVAWLLDTLPHHCCGRPERTAATLPTAQRKGGECIAHPLQGGLLAAASMEG